MARKIGCVAQDVFITDDSLKSNIAFGLEDNQINEKNTGSFKSQN